jgi:hypothetical protein
VQHSQQHRDAHESPVHLAAVDAGAEPVNLGLAGLEQPGQDLAAMNALFGADGDDDSGARAMHNPVPAGREV